MSPERRKLRYATEDEILQIIESVAAQARENGGYFYKTQVLAALDAAGINTLRLNVDNFIYRLYHIDDLGPKQNGSRFGAKPINANDPIHRVEPVKDTLLGMPDIGDTGSHIVQGGYRPGGSKKHGISRKTPWSL